MQNKTFKIVCKEITFFSFEIMISILVACIQLRAKQTAPLVNKNYQNEVTLTGQNPLLKCYQTFEILTNFTMGLDLLILEIWSL